MRILIIKLSAIGDVVQSLCVLNALKERYPDSKIDWLAGEAAASLITGHPMLENVIVYPRKLLGELCANPIKWPRLASESRHLLKTLRARHYDIAIDLQGLLKSGVLAWLSHSNRKLGFASGREASSIFLNEKLPPYDPDEHAVLRYMRLAYHLGADRKAPLRFPLGTGKREKREAEEVLQSRGIVPGRVVGLIPGTRWPTKHWTAEGFAAVSDLVNSKTGYDIAVLGSEGDRKLAAEIIESARSKVHDLTGTTSLRTLGAIFSMTAAVVSTDTGPMHLAAAAGTPVVALFGPTSHGRTGPFSSKSKVITSDVSCRPCFKRKCDNTVCMNKITPEAVAARLFDLLNTDIALT